MARVATQQRVFGTAVMLVLSQWGVLGCAHTQGGRGAIFGSNRVVAALPEGAGRYRLVSERQEVQVIELRAGRARRVRKETINDTERSGDLALVELRVSDLSVARERSPTCGMKNGEPPTSTPRSAPRAPSGSSWNGCCASWRGERRRIQARVGTSAIGLPSGLRHTWRNSAS